MSTRLAQILERKKRRRIAIVAVAAILFSMFSLLRTQCVREIKMDETPFLAQGEVAAEETVKALANKGTVVILTMDMGGTLADTTKLQLTSFRKTLKKSQITVVATENFSPPPYVDSDSVPVTEGVAGAFFLQVVRKHHGVNAIVSFAGAPFLEDEEIRALNRDAPGLIVAGNVGMGPRDALSKLFQANRVLFAVTPRTSAPPAGKPKTRREVFDSFYQIVTPENAGELSASF